MELPLIAFAALVFAGLCYACYCTAGLLRRNQIKDTSGKYLIQIFNWRAGLVLLLSLVALIIMLLSWQIKTSRDIQVKSLEEKIKADFDTSAKWKEPELSYILQSPQKDLILYGRQLIANTSEYLGPKGIVKPMSNGMNCQNCHLDAGTKYYGNNYSAVLANYPKFRARSGSEENISKRINDCIQRSLNGDSLKLHSKEMKAMIAYIHWLGQAVPKNVIPKGSGLLKLKYLDRPASPEQGQRVYMFKCQTCHGYDGDGLPRPDMPGYRYPPLWGNHSYNEAAGLFRLSTFAGYVKANMPFGAHADATQLTDEEAWDLAAYVNSKPRPKHKFLNVDWPDISKKPFDHPFGPFSDSFSVAQHKYGPFQPIIQFQKENNK